MADPTDAERAAMLARSKCMQAASLDISLALGHAGVAIIAYHQSAAANSTGPTRVVRACDIPVADAIAVARLILERAEGERKQYLCGHCGHCGHCGAAGHSRGECPYRKATP